MPVFLGSKQRIDSTPPRLPEINIESTGPTDLSPNELSANDSFTNHDSFLPPPGMLGLNSAKDSPLYPSGITAGGSPLLGRFPVTPSPLGASFVIETPKKVYDGREGKDGRLFAMQQERLERQRQVQQEVEDEAVKQKQKKSEKEKAKKERPETVYDPEDAYGGI
jgi:hypothetical protein